jgi:hypothetical protein
MLCHGPVRVEADAVPGPAKVRVAFPEGGTIRSFATEIPVVIR